jgi:hydrogenase nickel incorporation protein HypB
MCEHCGCQSSTSDLSTSTNPHAHHHHKIVRIEQQLLQTNDQQAIHNRSHFDKNRIFVLNLMSSPGAGKTTLLEAMIDALAGQLRIAVIEGDLETENDAARIRAHGVPAVQIVTGGACHLDAAMIHQALDALDLAQLDCIIIENVGNLVCPARFDLGQHCNVVLLSVPEGDDKPAKYPVMFRMADVILLTKSDLLPVLTDFSVAQVHKQLAQLAIQAPCLTVSASSTHLDITAWLDWFRSNYEVHQQQFS